MVWHQIVVVDVARLGLKAVVAGTLANLMSATIAGLFIELSGVAM